MEVAVWKTHEPQPEVPDFISSFLFDGTCEGPLIFPLAFSGALSLPLLVTSKSQHVTHDYVKDRTTSTHDPNTESFKRTLIYFNTDTLI